MVQRSIIILLGGFLWRSLAMINLSKHGRVSQSTLYGNNELYYGPQNAIDEPKSNKWVNGYCTHTLGGDERNWWKIEFPSTVYISTVAIYYRELFAKRMDGFKLSTTNDPDNVASSDVCFKDRKDGTANIRQTIDCHRTGKFLLYDIYKKDNKIGDSFIELCYLEINGCFYGFWGEHCTQSCSLECFGGNCFPENGSCVYGFSFEDDYSTRTPAPYSSILRVMPSTAVQTPLNSSFPANLAIDRNHTTCSKTEGTNAWIQIGFQRISVVSTFYVANGDTTQMFEVFASNSSWENKTLNESITHSVLVYEGTASLFKFPNLVIAQYLTLIPKQQSGMNSINICEFDSEGCEAGLFGADCSMTCPVNCGGPCDIDTGLCIFGCKDGWLGETCNIKCDAGHYGTQCSQKCSANCLSQPCNHVNGECTGGCKPGWIPDNCVEECGIGRYGTNCSEMCEGCVSDDCNHVNGLCRNTSSCKPGYLYGEKCNQVCPDWTYGLNCSEHCHCRNSPCDKNSGNCENGCEKGWRRETCDEECVGSYSYDCALNCTTCLNMTCDTVDGNCTYGCLSGYTGSTCQYKTERVMGDSAENMNGVIGGVISAILVVVILVAVIIIFWRRSSRKKPYSREQVKRERKKFNVYANQPEDTSGQYVNVSFKPDRSAGKSGKDEYSFTNVDQPLDEDDIDVNVYGNVQENQTINDYKIPIEDLENIIKEKTKNNGFQHEFELLPQGLMRPHIEGSKEVNKTKNRFKSTWPYDHSRVILKGDTNHDYINANFIDSYSAEKAYIAAQGPKLETVRDFWHMVWQEGVNTVVMVTKLEENGKKKCAQYWSSGDNKALEFDSYKICMTSEKIHSVYTHRCIDVINKKNNKKREVLQYHFTQWPDHGVPDKVKLVTFYRKVKSKSNAKKGPMLVHCSAGVGRTGTFIAIDALYLHGKTTNEVDVMEYVQVMRKDRMNMIQTHEQYIAVFEALLELFSVSDASIPTAEFYRFFDEQEKESIPSNQKLSRKQFLKLRSMLPSYSTDAYAVAILPQNSTKNADPSILAHNSYRPFLMSFSKGSDDYINAVIVPTFVEAEEIFVTQCPLASTVVDFWTMIYDHDCQMIVLLENPNANNPIWPDDETPLVFGNLIVHKENDITETDVNVTLEHKTNKEKRQLSILSFNEWNKETMVPVSTSSLVKFFKRVKEYRAKRGGKEVVTCRDGCTKSGLYVAVSLAIQKMELDDEIDIFQVVRQMQVRRPEFVRKYEQYEFCYKFLRDWLTEEESVYANA